MSVEKTLSIIKPDAVKRDLTGKIIAMFEEKDSSPVPKSAIQGSQKRGLDTKFEPNQTNGVVYS